MSKGDFDLEEEWSLLAFDIKEELRKAMEEPIEENENAFTWPILAHDVGMIK